MTQRLLMSWWDAKLQTAIYIFAGDAWQKATNTQRRQLNGYLLQSGNVLNAPNDVAVKGKFYSKLGVLLRKRGY